PAADVRANQVLAQHPLDGFLLQRELGPLVQHLDLDGAPCNADRLLDRLEQRAYELRLLPRLDFRNVEVDAGPVLLLRFVIVQRVNDETRNDRRRFLTVNEDLSIAKVQARDTVENRRPLFFWRFNPVGPFLLRMLVGLPVPLVREDALQIRPRFVEL